MSDYPMLISNKLHSFRNFPKQIHNKRQKEINGFIISFLNMVIVKSCL